MLLELIGLLPKLLELLDEGVHFLAKGLEYAFFLGIAIFQTLVEEIEVLVGVMVGSNGLALGEASFEHAIFRSESGDFIFKVLLESYTITLPSVNELLVLLLESVDLKGELTILIYK